MDENAIIEHLEELVKSFGIQIRSEAVKQDEDLVRVVGGAFPISLPPYPFSYVCTSPKPLNRVAMSNFSLLSLNESSGREDCHPVILFFDFYSSIQHFSRKSAIRVKSPKTFFR